MSGIEQFVRFARRPLPEKWAAIRASFLQPDSAEQRLLSGKHAAPTVLRSSERLYFAYRPDSDFDFRRHPELATLAER